MRALDELIDTTDPGWPLVADMVARATNNVDLLPARREDGERTLLAIQVTTRSPMGAVAHETGGILIDHGWLRILGSGHPRLPRDLAHWNVGDDDPSSPRFSGAFLVADDAIGGFFALNGGGLRGGVRNVFYLAPDTLEWEVFTKSDGRIERRSRRDVPIEELFSLYAIELPTQLGLRSPGHLASE